MFHLSQNIDASPHYGKFQYVINANTTIPYKDYRNENLLISVNVIADLTFFFGYSFTPNSDKIIGFSTERVDFFHITIPVLVVPINVGRNLIHRIPGSLKVIAELTFFVSRFILNLIFYFNE